jgi:DtxR family Mn-dependent transcriptional regulator
MGGNMAEHRDYLAKIYSTSEIHIDDHGYISTSALADAMGVTAPAVNRMVTKLKDMGYLLHEPYQGIKLTPAGQREALIKLRYQRIASTFLVNVMGFGWHEVEDEATRISGSLSDAIAQRMLEMASNPTHDPHGEPIPAPDGSIIDMADVSLDDIEMGSTVTITRVKTRESDRLEYIAALGLTPGQSVEVIHKAPFHGPMQLKLHGEYRIIGHNLAEIIRATVNK